MKFIHYLLTTILAFSTLVLSAQPCDQYDMVEQTGPYNNFDLVCAANPITATFEVWANEAYLISGVTAGETYSIDFCDGYQDAGQWNAIITIGHSNGATPAQVDLGNPSIVSVAGCMATFTATSNDDIVINISEAGNCGGTVIQTDNGLPTVTTDRAICPCSVSSTFYAGGTGLSATPVALCADNTDVPFVAANPNPEVIYVGFIIDPDASSEAAYNLASTEGSFKDFSGTVVTNVPATSFTLGDIVFLEMTQADIDAAAGGITTVSFISADGTTCGTLDIDWSTVPEAADVATSCPESASICGDQCDPDETYCSCAQDCPCNPETTYSWITIDGGNLALAADPTALCETSLTGTDNPSPEVVYVPFAALLPTCVTGAQFNTGGIGTVKEFDTNGDLVPMTVDSLASGIVGWWEITQADIMASGGNSTVTFSADGGACTGTLTVDWSNVVNLTGTVAATCPAGPETFDCAMVSGSTVTTPVVAGATFTVTPGAMCTTTADQDGFLLVYDFDPTTVPTATELYDAVLNNTLADVTQFLELSGCDGAGFVDLAGFNNTDCDPTFIDLYLMPIDTANLLLRDTCGLEGPISLEILPFDTLYVPGSISSGLYQAIDVVYSDGQVVQMDTVTFHAGDYIDLLPDFDVPISTQFTADPQPCGTPPTP